MAVAMAKSFPTTHPEPLSRSDPAPTSRRRRHRTSPSADGETPLLVCPLQPGPERPSGTGPAPIPPGRTGARSSVQDAIFVAASGVVD